MRNSCIFYALPAGSALPLFAGVRPAAAAAQSAPGNNPLLIPLVLAILLLLVILWRYLQARGQLLGLQSMTTNMIDSLAVLFIGIDSRRRIVEINRSALDSLGKPRQEILGRPFDEVFSDLPIVASLLTQVQEQNSGVTRDKVPDRHQERSWNIRISPWDRGGERGAILLLEEMTEQVQFENLMVQQEKLITISRLTVGMIHEINNPLASILQNMQVIHNRFGAQLQKNRATAEACGTNMEKIGKYLQGRGINKAIEAVRDAARRAALVIETLVNFSRQDEENVAFHSLSSLLDRSLELAAGDFDLKKQYDFRQIRITRDYDPELPPVRCRGQKLQQAFFALLRFRAAQILSRVDGDEPQLCLRLSREGDLARLQLEDNGPLLPQEERHKLFRPSLSTPDKGLGLCVCHFIICNMHGGTISFETNHEEKSRLVVRLPIERPVDG